MLRFQDLYESHAAQVYRFALWLSGDPPTAQDIVSDTFVRAWTRRDAIRTETLRAYLLTIARNLYLEGQRRQRRHVDLADTRPDPAPGPERQVQARQGLDRVRAELQSVSEIDRTAFVLRVEYELPYAEIARVLGISLSAAKVKVHRIRKRLLHARLDEEAL